MRVENLENKPKLIKVVDCCDFWMSERNTCTAMGKLPTTTLYANMVTESELIYIVFICLLLFL